ncbi:polyprenol phosphomannose-dependent alpha 1,6 mannosyltransferase MptB [Glutamicibacter protophormiae]|uniref:polyprenol phosphomannose-dependent alpha 1,6 mannosyltransferase MptB n=1 Tax=Glutamicibacter protophormiae TaxID=37930 RepID=UPI003BB1527F
MASGVAQRPQEGRGRAIVAPTHRDNRQPGAAPQRPGPRDSRGPILQGLLASAMVTCGSWGVGWLPYAQESVLARSPLVLPLRAETVGVIICTLLLAVGTVLMFRAWLRLRQTTKGLGDRALGLMRRAAWTWSAPMLFSFPILSQDVYSYLGQGRLMHAGLSPYENWVSQLPGWFAQGADSLWAESSSPYGPLFLMYARLAYFVSGGVPEYGVVMMRLVAVAGVALCIYAIPRLALKLGGDPSWTLWVSVVNPLFLMNMVGGVHNDGLMLGGVLLAFLLVYRQRRVLGTIAMALSIAIKPVMLLALPFLGLAMLKPEARLRSKIRVWLWITAITVAILAALGAATGLWFGWIGGVASSGDAAFPYAPVGLFGLLVGWIGSLFGGSINAVADIVYAVFKVFSMAIIAWLALRKPAGNPLLYSGYALAASVLLAPIIQPWYLLWLIPFFALGKKFSVGQERLLYVLCLVLAIAGVVDQLSVAQWFSLLWMRIFAALVGLLCVAYMVFIDPKTAPLFGHLGRRLSPRTRKFLRIPNPEETRQQDRDATG